MTSKFSTAVLPLILHARFSENAPFSQNSCKNNEKSHKPF